MQIPESDLDWAILAATTILTAKRQQCESSPPNSMTRSLDLETEQDELFPGEHKARPGIDTSQRIPGKREVDLYVRTYTTLLQSSGAVPVSSLIPAHLTAASSLHPALPNRTSISVPSCIRHSDCRIASST